MSSRRSLQCMTETWAKRSSPHPEVPSRGTGQEITAPPASNGGHPREQSHGFAPGGSGKGGSSSGVSVFREYASSKPSMREESTGFISYPPRFRDPCSTTKNPGFMPGSNAQRPVEEQREWAGPLTPRPSHQQQTRSHRTPASSPQAPPSGSSCCRPSGP